MPEERNLAAQLDAAFRQGEHTGLQLILSGEESQRGQRLQAYFGYLNRARQGDHCAAETDARRSHHAKSRAGREAEPAANAALRSAGAAGEA